MCLFTSLHILYRWNWKPLTGKTKAPQAVPIKDHLWVTIKLLYIVVSFVVIIAAIIMHNYNIIYITYFYAVAI